MTNLEWKLKKFWDAHGSVVRLVQEWIPNHCNNEAEAEESLSEFLVSRLPDVYVKRQYPHDRLRADIVVDDAVAIELKFNLSSTSEFQRVAGQLPAYRRWGLPFVLVLVGRSDPDLVLRLREEVGRQWGWYLDEACLIEKELPSE